MAFNALETSNQEGRPLFLYEFLLGDKAWRYTSADSSVSAISPTSGKSELFAPVFIEDDGVKQTGESQTDSMKIRMPFSEPIPQLFQVTPPLNQITVRRFSKHEADSEVTVNYVGFITQVNATEPGVAELECLTLSPTMQRNGLRVTWQKGCPYALYDGSTCKVNKAQYAVAAKILTAGAGVITADAFASRENGWFDGGFIEWTDSYTGALERRGIDEHLGKQLRLLGKSDGLLEGMDVKAYPGCQRTSAVCAAKYNNLLNYGGYPHLPGKSPFDGDPLY